MASATGPLIRSMPKCCITAVPALFTPKHPPLSKPTKFSSLSASFPSWISLRNKVASSSGVVPIVSQISDWAQEEETEEQEQIPGDGFKLGGEEVGGEGVGTLEDNEDPYTELALDAKLFVGGLPFEMDSRNLAGLFEQAGVVEMSEVIYNRETDRSRGFGFVTMSTVEEAEKAIATFDRYEVSGRFLSVTKAAPRGSSPETLPRASKYPSFKMYVYSLPWKMDDFRLVQVFSEHGKVVAASVVYDMENKRSRGFGFVTMSSETEMSNAIAALDGQFVDGRSIKVRVAEERRPPGSV